MQTEQNERRTTPPTGSAGAPRQEQQGQGQPRQRIYPTYPQQQAYPPRAYPQQQAYTAYPAQYPGYPPYAQPQAPTAPYGSNVGAPVRRPAQGVGQQQARAQKAQPKQAQRRSKAEALAIVNRFERGIVIGAFVVFGTFTALVASHVVGAGVSNAAGTTSSSSSTNSSSTGNSSTNDGSSTSSSSQSSGGFFNPGGGSSFGNSNSSQAPVSSSSAS